MDLSLKLEQAKFEGPLDLLLHLIDKNKVDIMDIPIADITDQYFEYLEEMERTRSPYMDQMSDFLVMAATLLDIKARLLLPPEKDEEGEEIDPRSELVEKLLEYKMYKYMSYELKEREESAAMTFYHAPDIPGEVKAYREPVDLDALFGDLTLTELKKVFDEVMKRQEERVDPIRSQFGRIEKEKVNVRKVMASVHRKVMKEGKCTFRSLLTMHSGKEYVVAAFLTVLELMRMGRVSVVQDRSFGEITITARDPSQWDSEYDEAEILFE